MPDRRLRIEFLSDLELDRIEETAYTLLAEVGISLDHSLATEMLHGLGCRIERDRVFIPPAVVDWGLANVTPHNDFYNRDGSYAFSFGDGRLRFHNAGGLPFIYDLETGERRRPTIQDVVDATRVLDALSNVDVVIPLLGPTDVPSELLAVASTDALVRNTGKPFSAAAIESPLDVSYVVEMAAACCGGMEAFHQHPNMYISVSPVSPLKFPNDVTSTIIEVSRRGVPFNSLPAPSLGATGPVTLAAALAQQHAELLASFVIAAAANPGAQVTYCSRINPVDPRTAISSWGGPEIGMAGAIATQLAHRRGLPCDSFGFCTSATRLDPQCAYERLTNALTPALAGTDILSGVAGTESVMAGVLELAVMDDEIISMIRHLLGGVTVDDSTLALDVMREVIPRDGVFLGEMHTVKQIRKGAIWMPTVSDRTGQVSGVDRARARAQDIVARHQPPALSEDVVRQLDEIMERARRELSGQPASMQH
ncbi:MAG: trimethylamine methyltransferase family protein [Nitrososphaerales archaeon]